MSKAWHLVILLHLVTGSLVCRAAPESKYIRFDARFKSVTSYGSVQLEEHGVLRLAGIRIRSVEETQEPALLDVVNELVTRESPNVAVEVHELSKTATIYFKQQIYYYDMYGPWALRALWSPKTCEVSVNELLIALGAAVFDPTIGHASAAAQDRMRGAAEKAELAKWESGFTDLSQYHRGAAALYTNRHGLRARLTKADAAERDRRYEEYQQRRETITKSMAGNVLDGCLSLVGLLSESNVFLRRFASRELEKCEGQEVVTALNSAAMKDEDKHVRQYAQESARRLMASR